MACQSLTQQNRSDPSVYTLAWCVLSIGSFLSMAGILLYKRALRAKIDDAVAFMCVAAVPLARGRVAA